MRNTLTWSYDLLAPEEQRLFRRLAVFVGGCTLEAAEAVCVTPEGAEPLGLDLLDGLGLLVDHSLIQQHEDGDEPRFGMLHVIREFALDHLEASGEAEVVRYAHAQFVLTLVAPSPVGLGAASDARWLTRLEHDHDNLRAALGWAIEVQHVRLGLQFGIGFAPFWWARGYYTEGRQWMMQVLSIASGGHASTHAHVPSLPSDVSDTALAVPRAWALWWAAKLAINQGDMASAWDWARECVDIAQVSGDTALNAVALACAANTGLAMGPTPAGMERPHVKPADVGTVQEPADVGNLERVEALFAEAVALARRSNDQQVLVRVLGDRFGALVDSIQDLETARALAGELLEAARHLDKLTYINVEAFVGSNLAQVAQLQGDVPSARLYAECALRPAREHGFMLWTAYSLEVLAWVADQMEYGERAARLLGAAAAVAERQGIVGYVEHFEQVAAKAAMRQVLGEDEWATAYAAGRALSLDDVITEALGC
jgi:hypothetical protein